jgi:hypothetical protein
MSLLAITQHSGGRLAELGFALMAFAGAVVALGSVAPGARRTGGFLGGLALAVGAVVVIVAIHWGHFS